MSDAALSYKPSPNVINLLCPTAHQCHGCCRTVSGNCAAQDQSAPPQPKMLGSDVTIHNRQLSEVCQFSFAKTKKKRKKHDINNNISCVRDAIWGGINDTRQSQLLRLNPEWNARVCTFLSSRDWTCLRRDRKTSRPSSPASLISPYQECGLLSLHCWVRCQWSTLACSMEGKKIWLNN